MAVRGESIKQTKDTYVCQRRIFNIEKRTPMSVRGESLTPMSVRVESFK
jgi:hypothetical protein